MNPEKKRFPLPLIVLYALTACSAILYFIFTRSAAFSDWFNRNVSTVGRQALAYLSNLFPFSVTELLILLIPFFVALLIYLAWTRYSKTWHDAALYACSLLGVICAVFILFVWNFSPGYYGTTLDQKLELDRREVSAEELYQTATFLREEIDANAESILFLSNGSSVMPYSYSEMNQKLLDAYESFCEKHDFINTYTSRVKPIMLSEPMSYTHITGVYTFFTGEANLNVNFPDYTLPYTAAHELAHQRGIAREDEANFIAFLVCMESDDPYIRYSAALSVYEYVASALYSASYDLYAKSYYELPYNVRAERIAYSEFFDKYRENVAADVSEATNNAYLQSQGAKEGTQSYSMVVDLAVAYYRPLFE